jgi:hypothetical protein
MKANGFDYATKEQMISHFSEYFYTNALTKMLNYGLITPDIERPEIYILTERGHNFESFATLKSKHSLEYEKLKLEIDNLRNEFFDYGETKSRAKWAIRLTILGILMSVVLSLLPMLCNKPD